MSRLTGALGEVEKWGMKIGTIIEPYMRTV